VVVISKYILGYQKEGAMRIVNKESHKTTLAKSTYVSPLSSASSPVRIRLRAYGFTLVELLVVIAIIALLLSILMPALGKVRAQGKAVVCAAHEKQYGLGLAMYINDTAKFPDYADITGLTLTSTAGKNEHSIWINLIAPYMGGEKIYASDLPAVKIAKSNKNMNSKFRQCPTGKASVGVHYGGFANGGSSGPFVYVSLPDAPSLKYNLIRQPATLIALLDVAHQWGMYSPTALPYNADWDKDGFLDTYANCGYLYNDGAPKVHSNACNIVLCDGHVERFRFKDWLNVNHDYWYDIGLGRSSDLNSEY
jgi:prepilin-type N-terminal cleavage/methylation domain-containing protein/prepilin-type processing-associated H-X9-DG protein